VVLFIFEAHGALHFSRGVDELTERIERQRMIVAAGGDEIEFACLVVLLLSIFAGEEEALDFSGGIERELLFGIELVGVVL